MKDIIAKRRRELGLTQQQLADRLNVSDKVVSKWETGRSLPDTSLLVPLANALQISLNELLDADGGRQDIDKAAEHEANAAYKNACIVTMAMQAAAALFIIAGRILSYRAGYYGGDFFGPFAYVLTALGALSEIAAISFFLVRWNTLRAKYPARSRSDRKYINILLLCTYPIVLAVIAVFVVLHGLNPAEQWILFLLCAAVVLLPFAACYLLNNRRKR